MKELFELAPLPRRPLEHRGVRCSTEAGSDDGAHVQGRHAA